MALVLTILGFMWWWPLGLLILGFLIARGKFGCWRHPIYAGRWTDARLGTRRGTAGSARWPACRKRWNACATRMDRVRSRGDWFGPTSSGNRAFDDYRAETLKRLEDEQREFKDFLARLRFAKDRAEFDQFMADDASAPSKPEPEPPPTEEPRHTELCRACP